MWVPKGGWNAACSEAQRRQAEALFLFFKEKKGISVEKAENMVHMILFQQMYPGLRYSKEQEDILSAAQRLTRPATT